MTNVRIKHGGSKGAGQHPSRVEDEQPPPLVYHLQRHTHKQCHQYVRQQMYITVK